VFLKAVWAHNSVFAAGLTWEAVQTGGVVALAAFWERFFARALNTAMSALTGYGLAKGWGWKFYLLASFLHACANYIAVLFQCGLGNAGNLCNSPFSVEEVYRVSGRRL